MTASELPRYLDGKLTAKPQDAAHASYRRPTNVDMRLSPLQSAEEIRWRCETLALQSPIEIESVPGVRVIGFRSLAGAPTGEPPRAGALTVDFDAADARVRVNRNHSVLRFGRRLGQFARYAGAPDR